MKKINWCSTWWTIKLPRSDVGADNDQTDSISGCREMELLFFGMGKRLQEMRIGQWAYDELMIYIGEMCKVLEVVEVNSDKVTDIGITHLLRKLAQLRLLDVSDCPNFLGTAFSDA